MDDKVICKVCNISIKTVTNSHLKKHNLLPLDYLKIYPNAVLISDYTKRKKSSSMMGHITSEETRKKISIAHKGKKLSEEHRKKISLTQKGIKKSEEFKQKLMDYNRIHGNPFKGKKHTEETKRLIGELGKGRTSSNKGKSWSEEIKKKISKKLIGRKLSFETRQKMSIIRKGRKMPLETREKMRGLKRSIETREKISKANKGKKLTKEHLKKIFDSMNNSPNKFEQWALNLFMSNGLPLKFVGNFKEPQVFIAGKVPDFIATNSKKVLVEIYNEFYKIKDYGSIGNFKEQRGNTFGKYGWKTIFFSEKELRSDPNRCVSELKKELLE